jgi:hypothetical protein
VVVSRDKYLIEDPSYEQLMRRFYDEGWTDGMPFVLPTPTLVEEILDSLGRDPDEVIGIIGPSNGAATLRLAVVNAVMAGCTTALFPFVEAALRAMLEPAHNLGGVTCTTHMCVPLVIVNGPQRLPLGFITQDGLFGNGSRANGAVGRALRLIIWNIGKARPGAEDKSTLSHPGEWAFCIAEDEENSPWEPLCVERGLSAGDAVTVFACEGPHSVIAQGGPKVMLDQIAAHAAARGSNNAECRYGRGEMLIVVNAAQANELARAGWSKGDVKRYIWEHTTWQVRDLLSDYDKNAAVRNGFVGQGKAYTDWGDPNAVVPITAQPDDLLVVVGGGHDIFAAVCPSWGPFGGFAVSKPVL